jgi:eukaryotic-like serine/threonine-protein kinase
MSLIPGFRLGPYEIQAPLGAGGMGEVYKARDTRLDRVVAIKVLPGHVAADPQLRERFEREARAISSLSHPHICALYDVGSQDGIDFLVMEYLDGETLADRIARGRVPLDEALPIARQIVEALEAAHDKGIVHRDLKPANVMLTRDGHVKVLDFGLSKVHADAAAGADVSTSPTVMATTLGTTMGTAAYMSPEQATGGETDRAADVWAFGCVLYEMLTGHHTFEGTTASEILANVLKTEPDWYRLPTETPASIRRLLRRSLRKDQKLRLRDIREVRLDIDDLRSATSETDRATPVRSGRSERVAWATALTLVAMIAGVLGVRSLRPTPLAPELRLDITTPPTRDSSMAISPDGRTVVFTALAGGQSQLWLRSLDSSMARPLAGTERASSPFWSPDNRSIGFIADRVLKRVDIDGGSLQTLAKGVPVALGGSWSRDGTIIFGNNPGGPIFRIPDTGGEPVVATRVEAQQRGHAFPQFLADGRHFLFFVSGSPEGRGVYVGELDGLDAKRLFAADTPAVYAAPGHLLFIREGQLLAHDFDPDRLELRGDPYVVAEQMTAAMPLSASAAGPIAYRAVSGDSGQRQLLWVDRSGRETDKVVYPDTAAQGPSLSRDGRRLAVYRFANGNMDIWSYETSRRVWDRLTFAPGDDIYPLWSRDGSSIVSGSARSTNVVDLYRTLLSAPQRREELLHATSQPKFPMDWSMDGRLLLYDSLDPKRGFDIWALPLEENGKPFEVIQTDFNESLVQFSPDEKWIAYQSDRTGRYEIYLRPFPGPGSDSLVSTAGGTQVRWSPSGKELFYIAPDDWLIAIPISFPSDGKTAEFGTPVRLFATSVGSTAVNVYRQQYVVTHDGRSFVMHSVVGDASAAPITVILNWSPKESR